MYDCGQCRATFYNLDEHVEHVKKYHPAFENSVEKTLADRAKIYGNFAQEAVLVENIKKALRAHPKWDYLPQDCKLALEMIVLKQVRAVNNFSHIDNWHDIGGYAKLVEDRLIEQKREMGKE